jgi:hypothetical protein
MRLLIIGILVSQTIVFAQSKKEQIELLNNGKVFEKIIGMSSISEYKSMINRALED